MDSVVLQNAWKARYFLGGLFFTWQIYQRKIYGRSLRDEVWGVDGNGGHMLKIVTDLTDEEMARLKYVRRLSWHWKGSRKLSDSSDAKISDQELSDRGIKLEQEPYIEYVKRPPHDKYL